MCTATLVNQKEFKFKLGDSTTLSEFDKLYRELFSRDWEVDGKIYNLEKRGWGIDYNSHKRSLGLCRYRKFTNRPGTIFISKTLLGNNLGKALDFEDVIRHEFAHAIDVINRGFSNHDSRWRDICRQVGANDSRLHEGFLEKPKGKYSASCIKCGKEHQKYRKPTRQSTCRCVGGFNADYALDWKQNY